MVETAGTEAEELEDVAIPSNETLPDMLGALIVRLSFAVAVKAVGVPESVSWKVSEVAGVTVVEPAAAEITPVVVFRLTPVGSVPPVSFHV